MITPERGVRKGNTSAKEGPRRHLRLQVGAEAARRLLLNAFAFKLTESEVVEALILAHLPIPPAGPQGTRKHTALNEETPNGVEPSGPALLLAE